jgi:phosphatidylinositol alpha-mannosyltransferase
MRIALVSANSFYFPGGVQEHIKGLYGYLKSRGHLPKIIGPRYRPGEDHGPDFIFLGRAVTLRSNASMTTFSVPAKPGEVDAILDQERFEIIHFHNPSMLTGIDILKKSSARHILTIHFLAEASPVVRLLNGSLEKWIKRNVGDRLHGIIAVSRAAREKMPRAFKCPVVIIPNGIELPRFGEDVGKIQRFADGRQNILFLGRIEKRKGLDYLLRAYARIRDRNPRTRLIVAGSGNDMNKCRGLARALGLPDVEFVGGVSEADKPRYFATADVFCSPALYGESFGIVLIEAMASGRPVVAFANEGYKQVLVGPAREFLVAPGDIDGLAQKLETLLENAALRKRLASWGLAECRRYSWETVGREIERFYEQVLDNGKGEGNPARRG